MSITGSAHEATFFFEIAGESFGVIEFTAHEKISSLYEADLFIASEDEIAFDDMIGKSALLTISGSQADRYFQGILTRFTLKGKRGRFYLYRTRLLPNIWFLSKVAGCRIFQNKNVTDIVIQLLQESGIDKNHFNLRLQNKYSNREYCVQYRETNLNFIFRLLEEEGIFFFFEHSENGHKIVFGDSTICYQPIQGEQNDNNKVEVLFHPPDSRVPQEEYVYEFGLTRQIQSGKVILKDFNFEHPSLNLMVEKASDNFQSLALYDYPGKYYEEERGKKLAGIRLEENMTYKDSARGKSVCPRLIPGFTFLLTCHEQEECNEKEYFITEVIHKGTQPQILEEISDSEEFHYFNNFMCIPSSNAFRPKRKTRKPLIEGVQTALVVGPTNEEIYTDEYGRVKVQFHWDREGKRDEESSCWIRVSNSFAGAYYGSIFTPRIGHEVLVIFLEGDPDKPIIIGSLYNAGAMPPYALPDEKTRSTIKTNSSKGGKGFNEIRFDDEKGEEEIFIHAEKKMDLRIKSNRREWVGNDRHLVVKRDKLEQVERDTIIIIKRDELKEITRDHNLKIKGKEAIEIKGSRSIKVDGDVIESFRGKHSKQVSQSYYIKANELIIEGMTGLSVKVGGNFITINSGGIYIKGNMVMLNSGGSALSGTAGNIVPPAAPLEAEVAGTASPGRDPAYDAPWHQEEEEEEEEDKSWIEIQLVDENDQPIAGERYRITLPDGQTIAEGTTDSDGLARVSGIDPGTCKITFPNLDKEAWEKI